MMKNKLFLLMAVALFATASFGQVIDLSGFDNQNQVESESTTIYVTADGNNEFIGVVLDCPYFKENDPDFEHKQKYGAEEGQKYPSPNYEWIFFTGDLENLTVIDLTQAFDEYNEFTSEIIKYSTTDTREELIALIPKGTGVKTTKAKYKASGEYIKENGCFVVDENQSVSITGEKGASYFLGRGGCTGRTNAKDDSFFIKGDVTNSYGVELNKDTGEYTITEEDFYIELSGDFTITKGGDGNFSVFEIITK